MNLRSLGPRGLGEGSALAPLPGPPGVGPLLLRPCFPLPAFRAGGVRVAGVIKERDNVMRTFSLRQYLVLPGFASYSN